MDDAANLKNSVGAHFEHSRLVILSGALALQRAFWARHGGAALFMGELLGKLFPVETLAQKNIFGPFSINICTRPARTSWW